VLSGEFAVIKALLVDDESLARRKLRGLLQNEPAIQVVGEAASAAEALTCIKATAPQLLFLDVRLPGMDGMGLMEAIAADPSITPPQVIFTTAYDHYALRAFDLRAVDYLLKPFTAERLHAAVQRVLGTVTPAVKTPATFPGKINGKESYTARIVFKSRGRILFLPVTDIRWIGAEENYVRICTDKESHLLRETMTAMEQKLDPQMFLRVHRSAIVNLQFVKEVRTEAQGDFVVHLISGQRVAMSRSYHARLGNLLTRASGRVA
jgi:two-component system, LytTR family, response regulator